MDLCTVISQDYIPQAVNLIQSYKVNSFDGNVFVYYFNTKEEQLDFFDDMDAPISEEMFYAVCCDEPNIVMESGCKTCKFCGWSACHIA